MTVETVFLVEIKRNVEKGKIPSYRVAVLVHVAYHNLYVAVSAALSHVTVYVGRKKKNLLLGVRRADNRKLFARQGRGLVHRAEKQSLFARRQDFGAVLPDVYFPAPARFGGNAVERCVKPVGIHIPRARRAGGVHPARITHKAFDYCLLLYAQSVKIIDVINALFHLFRTADGVQKRFQLVGGVKIPVFHRRLKCGVNERYILQFQRKRLVVAGAKQLFGTDSVVLQQADYVVNFPRKAFRVSRSGKTDQSVGVLLDYLHHFKHRHLTAQRLQGLGRDKPRVSVEGKNLYIEASSHCGKHTSLGGKGSSVRHNNYVRTVNVAATDRFEQLLYAVFRGF